MMILILGCLVFFGVHSIHIVCPKARSKFVTRWGEHTWKLSYSLAAIVGLVMIIMGYGAARHETALLYVPPTWGRSVSGILMLPVFPLLLATYLPSRIQRGVKHPMLWAVLLWATAHLLSNGNWADVILFGGFFAWALADLLSFLYRPAREIRRLPATPWNDIMAIVGGLVLYGLFVLVIHRWITGIGLM